ncbi:MAG: hypothetical protein PHT54_01050 [Candidatus Nanoarchaeia archaeon]|nr:hypothetical protein [Candidatus Nanoarchaeia archaeon]
MIKKILVMLLWTFLSFPIMKSQELPDTKIYETWGVSFEYPEDMEVKEGVETFRFKNEQIKFLEAVVLSNEENETSLVVALFSSDALSNLELKNLFMEYITSLEKTENFYRIEPQNYNTPSGHIAWGLRFFKNELIGSTVVWYCDKSRNLFLLTSTAGWQKGSSSLPGFNMEEDPSYPGYKLAFDSFKCH